MNQEAKAVTRSAAAGQRSTMDSGSTCLEQRLSAFTIFHQSLPVFTKIAPSFTHSGTVAADPGMTVGGIRTL